jgi:ATP-binding cassette subfamily B protein
MCKDVSTTFSFREEKEQMLKTLLAQVKEFKVVSLLTPVFMVLEVAFEMIIPRLMASIIDKGVSAGDINHIYKIGGLMLVTAFGGLLCGIAGGVFGSKASAGFARNLRDAMFTNIQTFSFANIDRFSTAGLVTRLTTDVTNLQNAYMMALRMFVRSPATFIVAIIMSVRISPKLALIYVVAVALLGCVMAFLISHVTVYFRQVFEKYDALNESVQENVSAIRVVKAYVREDYENKKFSKASYNIYRMFLKAEGLTVFIAPVMQFTIYGCILALSWFGAQMIVAGELSTGDLMSLLAYCLNILTSLMFMAMIFVMVTMSIPSGKRVADVINEKSTLTNPENPVVVVKDGSIEFENVVFSYHEDSEEPVLQDINISIRSGETIGIIGATGSSKSSLVSLVSRLYDVSQGSVKVGGLDVREYDLDTLRREVAVVLQKNVLFSGTILDNLRWGDPDATFDECRRACRLACADEFIEKMPEGYNTQISQGGTNVSGGQKQRLCIARALLRKPKILILDDSTSAVDTATDARIRKAFAEEIPDTTKLIIAQRISSVKDADRILVLNEGRVQAFGSHEELMECSGIYKEIYEAQTGGSGDFDEAALNDGGLKWHK